MFNRHGTEFIHDKVRFVSGEHWKIWRCDVELSLLCYLWLGLRTEYYDSVPLVICCPVHSISSWSRIIALYHRVRGFYLFVQNLRLCRLISSRYFLWSPSSTEFEALHSSFVVNRIFLCTSCWRLKFASRIEISTNIGLEPRSIRIPDPRVIPPPSTSRPEPQFWQRRSL